MKPACVILAAVVLAYGQTTSTKATTPAKAASPAKPHAWERSKECAAQAEKMVAGWSQRVGSAPTDWNNHYSPMYDKCFVSISSVQISKDEKMFPTMYTTALFNAFERSPALANYCTILGHDDCVEYLKKLEREQDLDSVSTRLNGKPYAEADATEQDAARKVVDKIQNEHPRTFSFCEVDDKPANCAKAQAFITEHMKN